MLEPGFYNMDCMEGMREFPDGFFNLAIVDPVYGGVTQGGYMKNLSVGVSLNTKTIILRFGSRRRPAPSISRSCSASAGIKSSGAAITLPSRSGGILRAGLSGTSSIPRIVHSPIANWPGLHLIARRAFLGICGTVCCKETCATRRSRYIPHKSPWRCTTGSLPGMPPRAT